jgi:hypothetical protein
LAVVAEDRVLEEVSPVVLEEEAVAPAEQIVLVLVVPELPDKDLMAVLLVHIVQKDIAEVEVEVVLEELVSMVLPMSQETEAQEYYPPYQVILYPMQVAVGVASILV